MADHTPAKDPGRRVPRPRPARGAHIEGKLRGRKPNATPPGAKRNSGRRGGEPAPVLRRAVARSRRFARLERLGKFGRRRGGPVTVRAALLALVLALLALSLTYPVRRYFVQRDQIARVEAAEERQKDRISELEAQKERWKDPAYVKAQARQRLQYVEPGEVAYVIIDDPAAADDADDKRGATRKHGPWYDQLWSTVQAADQPRRVAKKGDD